MELDNSKYLSRSQLNKNPSIGRLIIFITFFLLFTFEAESQVSAQISIPFEIYDNAGGQKTLYFGLDQSATSGIDIHLGESDLPPYPPTGAFDARWLLPENNFIGTLSSWLDYRNVANFPFSGTIEHRFRFQSAMGATTMFVSWDFPPDVTALIQDLSNGTNINVPISGSGTYQMNDFQSFNRLKLFVTYNNVVSVGDNYDELADTYKLEQNYPNPFNPTTKIKFAVPPVETLRNASSKTDATSLQIILKVYDVLGNEIATLVNEYREAGRYEVEFEAESLSSGIYFYTLQAGSYIITKKMILIR